MTVDLKGVRRVAIFSPVAVTGGPEAIHQLSDALIAAGVDCSIIYYGQTRVDMDTRGFHTSGETPEVMRAYAHYRSKAPARIPWDDESLLILPETMALISSRFTRGRIAIWWLSVDNALRTAPRLADPAVSREFFSRSDLTHLYQSAYARDVLRNEGAANIAELRDYTSPLFTDTVPSGPPPRAGCVYNATKGGTIGQAFFEANPDLDGMLLAGFTKPELRDIFSTRQLYIDFGHLPGQDRMPREAAACGALSFVHRRGAGAYHDDFPLDDLFKFDLADVESGALAERVRAVLADPQGHWPLQQAFRDRIHGERAAFQARVAELFGS